MTRGTPTWLSAASWRSRRAPAPCARETAPQEDLLGQKVEVGTTASKRAEPTYMEHLLHACVLSDLLNSPAGVALSSHVGR